ncbi:hypothetical protein C8034_v004163 [Colletotrichum sidae]|uniref:Uncharacterized protein n=1 Tax=Colletotrichum sidae TaxID=1347389 RepID=A0A4R8T8H2_9PEZI|nr:hypothetical protein C8034_v004163 [Colletotrichum sidae]
MAVPFAEATVLSTSLAPVSYNKETVNTQRSRCAWLRVDHASPTRSCLLPAHLPPRLQLPLQLPPR